MRVSYQLLIAILLVAFQTTQGLFGCSAYEKPSATYIERCILIEELFENALLSDKKNLYILRDTFLSSSESHPSPYLLNVYYHIYGFDENIESDIKVLGWTTSKVFTVIDLPILHNCQSSIMTLIYYLEGILFPETIYMTLNISGYQFDSSYQFGLPVLEHLYGITAITQRVSLIDYVTVTVFNLYINYCAAKAICN